MKKFSSIKYELDELTLPIGLIVVTANSDLTLLFANDMFAQMLGYDKPQELIDTCHKSAWSMVFPDDIE
ncbi:MAG: PAS domain-containing protein, partial [Oscillospiraceae bacterium]